MSRAAIVALHATLPDHHGFVQITAASEYGDVEVCTLREGTQGAWLRLLPPTFTFAAWRDAGFPEDAPGATHAPGAEERAEAAVRQGLTLMELAQRVGVAAERWGRMRDNLGARDPATVRASVDLDAARLAQAEEFRALERALRAGFAG